MSFRLPSSILARPADLRLPAARIKYKRGRGVVLETNATALFVVLTTYAQGRFADNAFALLPGRHEPGVPAVQRVRRGLFAASLRVEHLDPAGGVVLLMRM